MPNFTDFQSDKFYDIWTQQRRSVRRWKISEQNFGNFTISGHFFWKKAQIANVPCSTLCSLYSLHPVPVFCVWFLFARFVFYALLLLLPAFWWIKVNMYYNIRQRQERADYRTCACRDVAQQGSIQSTKIDIVSCDVIAMITVTNATALPSRVASSARHESHTSVNFYRATLC